MSEKTDYTFKGTQHLTPVELEERHNEFKHLSGNRAMQVALYTLGIVPEFLAEKLKAELEASVLKAQCVDEVVIEVDVATGNKRVTRNKHWEYSAPMIDWPTRQRARQDASKHWGMNLTDGKSPEDGVTVIEINTFDKPKEISNDQKLLPVLDDDGTYHTPS